MFSKRIEAIASLIDSDSTILDVGCDHGYLPIYLMLFNHAKKVYASDISESAVQGALKNFLKYNLDIDVFCCDGLNDISVYYDTLVICGMGYNTIKKILSDKQLCDTIIIQSNSDHYLLRLFMNNLGFMIDSEITILDKGIYYVLIKYVRGSEVIDKKFLHFGKSANNDYFLYNLSKLEKIFGNLPKQKKYEVIILNSYLLYLLEENRI